MHRHGGAVAPTPHFYRLRLGVTIEGHPAWLRHGVAYAATGKCAMRAGLAPELIQVELAEPGGPGTAWVTLAMLEAAPAAADRA